MTLSCELNERHLGVWMIKFEIGRDDGPTEFPDFNIVSNEELFVGF